MGHKIVYCSDCGKSILEAEFEKGRASTFEDRPYCAACRPPPPAVEPAEKPSSVRLTPPSQRKIATARIPISPSTTRRVGRPASKLPLIAGGAVAGVGVLILLVFALSSGDRPVSPAPEAAPAPKAAPVARPTPPATPKGPSVRDAASSAEIERAMREEAERAKARKLDLFLADIRKMADEDRRVQRRDEIERMLKSATDMAGNRRAEVERLRADVRKKQDEHQVRLTFVAHWKLDEKSGGAAADSAGADHAGTLQGGPAWTGGRRGGALSFDGKDDAVRVPNAEGLSPHEGPEGEMTLAAWVRIPERPAAAGQGRTAVVAKGDTGAFEYALYVSSDGRAGFCAWTLGGVGYAEVYGGAVAIDRWHHLAGSLRKGRFARLYVDGVLANEVTAFKGETAAGSSPLFLGRRGDGQFFKGSIDDARLYSRVLSDAELKALAEGRE